MTVDDDDRQPVENARHGPTDAEARHAAHAQPAGYHGPTGACQVWVVDMLPPDAQRAGVPYGRTCPDPATHLGVVGTGHGRQPTFPLCDGHARQWPNAVRKIAA